MAASVKTWRVIFFVLLACSAASLLNPLHNTCCLLYRIVVLPTGKSIPSIEIGILCFVETHGP